MKRVVLLLFLAATQASAAGVYKWVDEQGRVHYGERPPTAAKQAKEMTLDKAPPTDPYAEERRARMQRYAESSNEEQTKRQEQQAKAKEDQQERKRNCSTAKSRVHSYTDAGRIYRTDENGERHYLDDNQRVAELREAQARVDKWCR